jgi:hypothetical protein
VYIACAVAVGGSLIASHHLTDVARKSCYAPAHVLNSTTTAVAGSNPSSSEQAADSVAHRETTPCPTSLWGMSYPGLSKMMGIPVGRSRFAMTYDHVRVRVRVRGC